MPRLHLLNQPEPFPQPEKVSSDTMESGFWYISETRAKAVIGHPIYFHRRKSQCSFLSGVVCGYRRATYVSPQGRKSMRTVFLFKPGPDHQMSPGTEGWTPGGVKLVP